MSSSSLICIILRLLSLCLGWSSFRRGVMAFYLHPVNSTTFKIYISLSIIFVICSVFIWLFSKRISVRVVSSANNEQVISWSSESVVFSGIILICFYSLFIDVVPELFDYISRLILLISLKNLTVLNNMNFQVTGIISILKVFVLITVMSKSRIIADFLSRSAIR